MTKTTLVVVVVVVVAAAAAAAAEAELAGADAARNTARRWWQPSSTGVVESARSCNASSARAPTFAVSDARSLHAHNTTFIDSS